MYVCVCNAVSERQVRRCIEDGIDNLAHIKRHCQFRRSCGSCSACIRAMINEHQPPQTANTTVK